MTAFEIEHLYDAPDKDEWGHVSVGQLELWPADEEDPRRRNA